MNKKEYFILSTPLIITLIILVILNKILCGINEITINNFEMISNNYINFVSILVGFLITTISIVIGFFDKKIVKIIVQSKKDKILYLNWFLTIITGVLSIVILFGIAATFNEETSIVYKVPFNMFIFFMCLFLLYLVFSLIYFFGIAKSVMSENLDEEERIKKSSPDNIVIPKRID